MHYRTLAISHPDQLIFGTALKPLPTRSGMIIGGGAVYPELNFTLPPMTIDETTMPAIRVQYRDMVREAAERAADLAVPGLVVEFETLPPMVENPSWGIALSRIICETLDEVAAKRGLKSVVRITPNDLRDIVRPPLMRSGPQLDNMMECFRGAAAAGAELLSIESIGGKEVCDDALTMCDLPMVIFSLACLGVRDMRFLWAGIARIAADEGVVAAGDTACGFGNTAMVLAERKYIPRVFAAVVRAISAVRSLVAYEEGAVGPGKDCGYENVFLKAITGFPMAMEGKTAACAHLSPVGNIAACVADTWSNESVQNVRLLAGMAPTCYVEQLAYDCRLMNVAAAEGPESALLLRNWMAKSDAFLDPQAYVLAPASAMIIAEAIVSSTDHYTAAVNAAKAALGLLVSARSEGSVAIEPREAVWLDRMGEELETLPSREGAFIDQMLARGDLRFTPAEYGL